MKDETKTKEQLIKDPAALRDQLTEEAFEHCFDIGTAVNALLRLSLEDYSFEVLLQNALDIILSVPSLCIETTGSIFLVEDEPEVLIQKVQKGLAEPLLKECARVPFGKCLCGRAASIKRIEFADHIDERHEIGYENMPPHGHYCVPILLSGNTIGVINLYLKDGYSRVGREEEFLDSLANILAGIIKRKREEEALKASEEKYRSFANATSDIVFLKDDEFKHIMVNQACIDFYKLTEAEILGKTDIDFMPGKMAKNCRASDIQVREGNKLVVTIEQDEDRIFETRKFPVHLKDGKIGSGGIVRDITDRKRAEEKLKEKDKFMESMVQSSAVATFVVDAEHKVVYWNKACEDLTGIKSEDLLGTSDHWKAFYDHPRPCVADLIIDNKFDEMTNLYEVYARSVLIPDGIRAEGWYPNLGGKNRYIVFDAAPIRDDNGKIAAAIETLQDITQRKQAEEKLLQTLESLRKAFGTTVQVMVSAVETKDPYTAGHQLRSADLARAIATEIGFSQDRIDGIRMAGVIHDIGKLSVPAEILSKPTKLSEIEFSLIKEHAKIGFEILKDVESPWPLAQIVYQHHERMDGSGYPRHLKGDEILMEARIMAVADVVESMASYRPYRPAIGLNAALKEIEDNKGTLYDADVVDACLRLFREKGFKLE